MIRFTKWALLFLVMAVSVTHCGERQSKEGGSGTAGTRLPGSTSQAPDKDGLAGLNEIIRSDTANPEGYYQRANHYIDIGDFNSALSDINRAIALDGKNSRYFVTLSDIYLAIRKVPNCLDALQKAEALDPGNNDALLKTAELYLILRDYDNTLKYVRKALDLNRHNPTAYFISGYARMERGDTAGAIHDLQLAVDQDQQYYDAIVELGMLYDVKRDPLAVSYFRRATEVDPNRESGWYMLGMAYQEREAIGKAMEAYQRLLILNPKHREAMYNLGYIQLVYLEDFQKAIELFTGAIDIDPDYADAYYNRGYAYELNGDKAAARSDYQRAMKLVTNHELAIRGLNRLEAY